MEYNPRLLLDDYPITMYDCDEQKLVAIFRSKKVCSVYIFGKSNRITGITIRDKIVSQQSRNPYKRRITFRTATQEQRDLLVDKTMLLILDDRFLLDDGVLVKKGSQSLNSSSDYAAPKRSAAIPKILPLAKQGHTPQEICDILELSITTVKRECYSRMYVLDGYKNCSKEEIQEMIDILTNRLTIIKDNVETKTETENKH